MVAPAPTDSAGVVPAGTTAWETSRQWLVVALVVGMAVSISLAEIAFAALALWIVLARRAGVLRRLCWPLVGPIVAFAVASLTAALLSEYPRQSVVEAKSLLTLGLVFVVVNVLPDAAAARRFATWLLLAVTGAAVLGLVQVAVCPGPSARSRSGFNGMLLGKCQRARGFYSIYMTLGGVLAMVLAGTLPRLVRLGREVRWLAPAWVVSMAALAVTYVRGAWLGLAAGAVTVAVGLGRRGLLAVVAVLLLVVTLVAVLPGVRARAASISDPTDATARDRLVMLRVGAQLVAAHPVTGIGPGNVKRVYPKLVPPEGLRRATSHLHNTPMQIAVERGIVGFAAWVWLFVAFFRRAWVVYRGLAAGDAGDRALVLGSGAAIVTFLVAGLFEHNFGDTEVLMVALALMAMPFVLERRT